MATGQTEWQADDDSPNRGKLSPEDEHILQQPYARAVSFMGYRPQLILHAVKMLQRQHEDLIGEKILLEVENLGQVEENGRTFPALEEECHTPERETERMGSIGSCETDGTEYFDAEPPEDDDELQTDGEQAARAQPHIAQGMERNEDRGPGGREAGNRVLLQHKLTALREENELLKARQKCRSCQHRPVSITFLPCGHYSYCYDCGHKFGACPICHKTILADVRTFLA